MFNPGIHLQRQHRTNPSPKARHLRELRKQVRYSYSFLATLSLAFMPNYLLYRLFRSLNTFSNQIIHQYPCNTILFKSSPLSISVEVDPQLASAQFCWDAFRSVDFPPTQAHPRRLVGLVQNPPVARHRVPYHSSLSQSPRDFHIT